MVDKTNGFCSLMACMSRLIEDYMKLIDTYSDVRGEYINRIFNKLVGYNEFFKTIAIEYCMVDEEVSCDKLFGLIYGGISCTIHKYQYLDKGYTPRDLNISLEVLEYIEYIARLMSKMIVETRFSSSNQGINNVVLKTLDNLTNTIDSLIDTL